MKIFALSDVSNWNGWKRELDLIRPDVTVLAGDLTSDGIAAFWRTALEAIPAFRRDRSALRKRLGVVFDRAEEFEVIPRASHREFSKEMYQLQRRYRETSEFLAARKKMHVDKFYSFLKYAGNIAPVLVIDGDHDWDFDGDYDPERIDSIPGCAEISGKVQTVSGYSFLGMGFGEAGFRKPIRRLISEFKNRIDIVVAHAPQKNVRLLAELRPRLIIRGHFGGGCYLMDGVSTVFTAAGHAIIKLGKGQPQIRTSSGKYWETALRKDYGWLQPHPNSRMGAKRGA